MLSGRQRLRCGPIRHSTGMLACVLAENRVSGSGAVSRRPRTGSGVESGCHKNRLDRLSGEREIGHSHALAIT